MSSPFYRSLLVYAALYSAFAVLAWLVPVGAAVVPILLSAWIGSGVGILLVWVFSKGRTDDRALLALFVSGVIIDVLFHFLALNIAASKVLSTALHGVGNLGLLMAAISVGLLIGRGLQKPNYLIMAAIVGAITDIYSVYSGPTKQIVSSNAFSYLSLHWGIIGQGGVGPIVGVGDFVFLTLFFFGIRRFELDDRKTFVAMLVAFGVGFLFTLISPAGIPALPFMSAALLLTHGRELKAKSSDV